MQRHAEVVHDDVGAEAGELERLGPAQAPAGPGDDRDLAVHLSRSAGPLGHLASSLEKWNTF